MFAIVEFPLSKEVEPVPKSWICKDGHCWWPNYRSFSKIKQAIIRMEEPNSDNYTSYPARILKYYGNYTINENIYRYYWCNSFNFNYKYIFVL